MNSWSSLGNRYNLKPTIRARKVNALCPSSQKAQGHRNSTALVSLVWCLELDAKAASETFTILNVTHKEACKKFWTNLLEYMLLITLQTKEQDSRQVTDCKMVCSMFEDNLMPIADMAMDMENTYGYPASIRWGVAPILATKENKTLTEHAWIAHQLQMLSGWLGSGTIRLPVLDPVGSRHEWRRLYPCYDPFPPR